MTGTFENKTYSDGTVATGPAPLPERSPALSWSDGVCPTCGSDEWDVERHWGQPSLSVYYCRCGALDHVE